VPVERFKSKEAYRRWTAYRHVHGIKAPHLKHVVVGKKKHKVKHSVKRKARKKKAKRKR
jgi:hypothetical protein